MGLNIWIDDVGNKYPSSLLPLIPSTQPTNQSFLLAHSPPRTRPERVLRPTVPIMGVCAAIPPIVMTAEDAKLPLEAPSRLSPSPLLLPPLLLLPLLWCERGQGSVEGDARVHGVVYIFFCFDAPRRAAAVARAGGAVVVLLA